MLKVFTSIVTLSMLLVGCTPVVTTTTNTNQSGGADIPQDSGASNGERQVSPQSDGQGNQENDGGAQPTTWKSFDNRALGYTVKFPANWYWRHFIKQEIDRDGVV